MKKTSMNLPNMLSILRVILVPVFVLTLILMRDIAVWGKVVPAVVYLVTGLTDMLDGKIARKYNLVTDFGKFIDPLADKFMVIGSLISMLCVMALDGETVLSFVSRKKTGIVHGVCMKKASTVSPSICIMPPFRRVWR